MSDLDDKVDQLTKAVEDLVKNKPEGTAAKLIVIALSLASGSPWPMATEPLLRRLLERLCNKAGKDAVAAIAKEVDDDEGYRRTAVEVRDQVEPMLRALFQQVSSSGDEVVTRTALLLHRMEERLEKGTPPLASPPTKPRVWTVPFLRNPYFMGREVPLEVLRVAFLEHPAATPRQPRAIHGLGGMGKSQLAVEYAWRHRAHYEAVLWATADTPERLRASLSALAGPAALDLPARAVQDEAVQVAAVLRWLGANGNWLLVLDGANSEVAVEAVCNVLPSAYAGDVLITSRHSRWPITVGHDAIDILSEDVASAFLMRRASRTGARPGTDEEARSIACELGGLPLALEQAAAYVERKRTTFGMYLGDLRTKRAEILQYFAEGATQYSAPVFTTWLLTEAEQGPGARALLRLMSFLATEETVPRDLFSRGGRALREAMLHIDGAYDPGSSEEDLVRATEFALNQLADYSMVTLSTTAVSCHRLVATVQQERLAAEEHEVWLTLALRILDTAAPPDALDVRTWERWGLLQPHVAAALERAVRARVGGPVLGLMTRLAQFEQGKGRWDMAKRLFREALSMARRTRASSHPELAACLANLADLLRMTDRLDEADSLSQEALQIAETAYGADHPSLALHLSNRATILWSRRRGAGVREAESLLRRALAIDEAFTPEGPPAARDLGNLACILHATGRSHEAERMHRRALAIDESKSGREHPLVAVRLNNLSDVLVGGCPRPC